MSSEGVNSDSLSLADQLDGLKGREAELRSNVFTLLENLKKMGAGKWEAGPADQLSHDIRQELQALVVEISGVSRQMEEIRQKISDAIASSEDVVPILSVETKVA